MGAHIYKPGWDQSTWRRWVQFVHPKQHGAPPARAWVAPVLLQCAWCTGWFVRTAHDRMLCDPCHEQKVVGMRACICGVVGCRRHGRAVPRTSAGDYGVAHQRRRSTMLASTPEICARCGGGPRVNDPWEAGHIQDAALGGGPEVRREHRSCNRKAGAQLGVALAKAKRRARSL